jgi:hypothetical protein
MSSSSSVVTQFSFTSSLLLPAVQRVSIFGARRSAGKRRRPGPSGSSPRVIGARFVLASHASPARPVSALRSLRFRRFQVLGWPVLHSCSGLRYPQAVDTCFVFWLRPLWPARNLLHERPCCSRMRPIKRSRGQACHAQWTSDPGRIISR